MKHSSRLRTVFAVRTSVLTLVVVTSDPSNSDGILATVRSLGTRHPSRAVVLVLDGFYC